MTEQETKNLFTKAIRVWGYKSQLDQAVEECSELILAIMKYKNRGGPEKNVVEEIADVEIMCSQLRLIFGNESVDDTKKMKLERLAARLALCPIEDDSI